MTTVSAAVNGGILSLSSVTQFEFRVWSHVSSETTIRRFRLSNQPIRRERESCMLPTEITLFKHLLESKVRVMYAPCISNRHYVHFTQPECIVTSSHSASSSELNTCET